MTDRVFLDSNILVYAYDKHEPLKQSKAQAILAQRMRDQSAVLSAQVLSEFFITVTRRIREPMGSQEALTVIGLLTALPVLEIDATLVQAAILIHQQHQISYWEGLIVAAAQRSRCARLLSEDLNSGQRYGDVVVENPLI